jgi:hypothetical protein
MKALWRRTLAEAGLLSAVTLDDHSPVVDMDDKRLA